MRTFSTSDLSRKLGNIIASALQGPLSISQRGKPRLIMLSVEQYEMLTARDVDRRLTPHGRRSSGFDGCPKADIVRGIAIG